MGISEKIGEYTDSICKRIKAREVHLEVKAEIQDHINELKEEYMAEGMEEEAAVDKAIREMGQAEVIGKQFNSVYEAKPEWSIVIMTAILSCIGIISLYFMRLNAAGEDSWFRNTLIFAGLGAIVIFLCYYFDYRKIKKFSLYVFIGAAILPIIFIYFSRYNEGAFKFQPIVPVILGVAIAGIFNDSDFNGKKGVLKLSIMYIVPVISLFISASIYGVLMYSVIFFVMAKVSGTKLRYMAHLMVGTAALFLILILGKPYRIYRILCYRSSYLSSTINSVMGSSTLLGHGTKAAIKIQDAFSEYILVYITHTFGWILSILVVLLLYCLVYKIMKASKVVKNSYGRSIMILVSLIIGFQAFMNVMMNLGLMPVLEIPLPFISYGGTWLITDCVCIGLILSVYRRKNIGEKTELQLS